MVDDADEKEDDDDDDFNMMSVFVTQPTHKISEYGEKVREHSISQPTRGEECCFLSPPPVLWSIASDLQHQRAGQAC